MMATSLKHEAFHKNLECPVCLSFCKEPKNLTCSHTFCKGCLQTFLESSGKLLCPTCREETPIPVGDVGRLQSNITVRSLVEDVEIQGQVCTNSNQENESLQRKWNKCREHPYNDEKCFCLNCNSYVCNLCGSLEHAKDAHAILEAGEHETEQKKHVEELESKADAKIRNVDKYFTFVEDQRKRVHNVQEELKKLKERKTVLENEIGHKLGKLKTSLGDVEKSTRIQIDQIKQALDLLRNGLNFPLQTEALTSHKPTCKQLKELLNGIGPYEELPRRTAEEGERIGLRSQGSDELQLGQLTHTREVPAHTHSKWVLCTEAPLPAGKFMGGMAISPNNEMAVGCEEGGIFIHSSDGIIQDTVLKSVDFVEDVEIQGQVCTNSNQENESLQRKWNKCREHPYNDEKKICLNCNSYVCNMFGSLEHAKDAHTIVEAGEHETEQKKHVEELESKADAKIRNVDKYFTFVEDQRKRVHNVHEQLKKLKERKTVLDNEIGHKLGKLKTSLRDVEKSTRIQIDEIKQALDLLRNGLNFPLQTEALTSHKPTCQQLKELLNGIGPYEELPRRTAEEGERIALRSQGSDELQLGQLTHTREVPAHTKSKWVLRTEAPLPAGKYMSGMVISPNNEMAIGCLNGGIYTYSSDGTIQDTVLKSVEVCALDFMPDGGYVIRDHNNRISLYTWLCEKLDVTFETYLANGGLKIISLTVGNDGLIFIGYSACQKIRVFKPGGGKAIREITCYGYDPSQMFAMTSSQAIVVKSFCRASRRHQVQVIDDVSGAIIHSIRKDGDIPYPAVCQDDSVIIAWVKHHQGLLSIVQYTKELKYIRNIITDFKMPEYPFNSCLQAFKMGEIAFCTDNKLYIFHETWE